MAITWPGLEPTVVIPPNKPAPEIRAFGLASSPTFLRGQLVDLTSGLINVVATNPSTVTGLALFDAGAIFQNVSGQAVISSLFGTGTNAQTPLWNTDLNMALVCLSHNGQLFEFSYNQVVPSGGVLALPGTTVGFTLTSGIFYADSSVSNKIATIVDVATVPLNIIGTGAQLGYAVGDTNARVIVEINTNTI